MLAGTDNEASVNPTEAVDLGRELQRRAESNTKTWSAYSSPSRKHQSL